MVSNLFDRLGVALNVNNMNNPVPSCDNPSSSSSVLHSTVPSTSSSQSSDLVFNCSSSQPSTSEENSFNTNSNGTAPPAICLQPQNVPDSDKAPTKPKLKRKALSLEDKLEILKKIDKKIKIVDIANAYGK